jgi:multiple sugar transport system substrate-binding protein
VVAALVAPLLVASGSSASGTKTITIDYQFQQTPGAVNSVGEWLESVKTQFEKANPGVTVDLNAINASESDYYTKIDLLQSSASTSPDIVEEDSFLISDDEAAGYLQPLTKEVDGWSDWSQFPQSMKDLTSYAGQVWGVPFDTDVRFLWYNKQLFAKAGIAVPWHPTTWAQVLSTLKVLKEKLPSDVIPMNLYAGTPLSEAASMHGYEDMLYGTGYSLYDYKTAKWVINDPGTLDAFKFYQDVYGQNLGAPPSQELVGTWENQVTEVEFPQGKLAVDLDGTWLPAGWTGTAFPNWEKIMGWTPFPTMNGQAPGYSTMSGGWTLAISKHATQSALSWDFIKMAVNKQNDALLNRLWSDLTTRKDSGTVSSYVQSLPFLKFSLTLIAGAGDWFRPAYPPYANVSRVIQVLTGDIATGSMTAQQAASSYAQQMTQLVGAKNVESVSRPMTKAQLYP